MRILRIAPCVFACILLIALTSAGAAEILTPQQAVNFRHVESLSFAPDGRRLVAVIAEHTAGVRASHLWTLRVADKEFRQVTFSAKNERAPEWSPDSQSLAFISDRSGSAQLYTIPANGGEPVALTSAEPVKEFHWAPDGLGIAYLAADPKPRARETLDDAEVADSKRDLPKLRFVEVATHHVRQISSAPLRIDQFVWLNDAQLLTIASDNPRREVWNTALYEVSLRDGALDLAATPKKPFATLAVSEDRGTLSMLASREAATIRAMTSMTS